jgi:hypothetical protein
MMAPLRAVQDADYVPGDPAVRVLGKPDEQPARVHRPLPRKPKLITAATVQYDIQQRMDQLRPVVDEVARLERALEVLEGI